MRPGDGVQRGSVMDMPVRPGDPLTPGVGATPGARRLALSEATDAHEDSGAADLVRRRAAAAGGDGAARSRPKRWRGALPITYRIGPGPGEGAPQGRVQLGHQAALQRDRQDSGIDVPGRVDRPRQPSRRLGERRGRSGQRHGAELEEARALGELRKQGWSPKRTIVYAAWDGEEPALLGSTEWVEAHADDLREHAVAYINTDGNGRGFLNIERLAFARALRQRRRARRQRSRDRHQRLEAAAGADHRPRHAGRAQRRARARATCASTRSAPGRTTRRSCSTPASRR